MDPWANTRHSVDELIRSLSCPSCGLTLRKPVVLGRCYHTFCKACIDKQCKRSGDNVCPECKEPFWIKDIHVDHMIENIISLCKDFRPKLEPAPSLIVEDKDKLCMETEVPIIHHGGKSVDDDAIRDLNIVETISLLFTPKPEDTNLQQLEVELPDLGITEIVQEQSDESVAVDQNKNNSPVKNNERAPLYHTPREDTSDSFVSALNSPQLQECATSTEDNQTEIVVQPKLLLKDIISENISQSPCELNISLPAIENDMCTVEMNDISETAEVPADHRDKAVIDFHQITPIVRQGAGFCRVDLPATPKLTPDKSQNITPSLSPAKSQHVKPIRKTYQIHKCKDKEASNLVNDWLEKSELVSGELEESKVIEILSSPGRENQLSLIASRRDSVKSLDCKNDTINAPGISSEIRSPAVSPGESLNDSVKSGKRKRSVDLTPKQTRKRKVSVPTPCSKPRVRQSQKLRVSAPTTLAPLTPKAPKALKVTTYSAQKTPRTPKIPRSKTNAKGESPLHCAAKKGDHTLIARLVEEGADPLAKDNAGWSALHEACYHQHLKCARLLLKVGTPTYVKANNLDTPLHDAVTKGGLEIIELLLEAGADAHAMNDDGKTPLDYAATEEVRVILKSSVPTKRTPHFVSKPTTCAFILFSGLSNKEVSKLSMAPPHTVVEEYTEGVTHLVCAVDRAGHCKRTLKFLQALVSGVSLVNVRWVTESTKRGAWLAEEPYLVKGAVSYAAGAPLASLMNHRKGAPPLFTGLSVHVDKRLTGSPGRDDIIALLQLGNATLLAREPKPLQGTAKVYHAPESTVLSYGLVISNETGRQGVVTRPGKWVLDCITAFSIKD